jgi:lysozyme family protein
VRDNFAKVMPRVFAHEGGYSNDPHDPGGATKYGITAANLGSWRGTGVATPAQVQSLTQTEALDIYRVQYAGVIQFDLLPSGVDYAVLDYAINSGVAKAAKDLQRVVGAAVDGHIGMDTINACRAMPPSVVVNQLCDMRLAFLKSLKTWKYFGAGWGRRVEDVRAYALVLAQQPVALPAPDAQPAPEPVPAPVPVQDDGQPMPAMDTTPKGSAADVPSPLSQSPAILGSVTSTLTSGGGGYALAQTLHGASPWLIGGLAALIVFVVAGLVLVFRDQIKARIEAGV